MKTDLLILSTLGGEIDMGAGVVPGLAFSLVLAPGLRVSLGKDFRLSPPGVRVLSLKVVSLCS